MIQSYSQLLQRRYQDKLDDTAHEFIRTIVDGVDTMTELTQGLLELAQAGDGCPERTNIRIGTVVDGALVNLQPMIEETRAEVSRGDLPTVAADRLQLLQLFQNLIGNALKYRHPERPPRIRITAEFHDGAYWFAIADNGLGIEAKHHERIFVPLKRLHGREIPGTGIGLAVCKKIVERHGGRIWVKSEPGQGSNFYFSLPVL
jgi:light-regulated signal transduction histidine kinase (bacteriophytochrome)